MLKPNPEMEKGSLFRVGREIALSVQDPIVFPEDLASFTLTPNSRNELLTGYAIGLKDFFALYEARIPLLIHPENFDCPEMLLGYSRGLRRLPRQIPDVLFEDNPNMSNAIDSQGTNWSTVLTGVQNLVYADGHYLGFFTSILRDFRKDWKNLKGKIPGTSEQHAAFDVGLKGESVKSYDSNMRWVDEWNANYARETIKRSHILGLELWLFGEGGNIEVASALTDSRTLEGFKEALEGRVWEANSKGKELGYQLGQQTRAKILNQKRSTLNN